MKTKSLRGNVSDPSWENRGLRNPECIAVTYPAAWELKVKLKVDASVTPAIYFFPPARVPWSKPGILFCYPATRQSASPKKFHIRCKL